MAAARPARLPPAEAVPAMAEAVAEWTDLGPVAHALGMTADGYTGTNSLEALEHSYERGFRVFEADLQLTSDGFLVARHDWDQMSYYNAEQTFAGVMDHDTFMSTPICFYCTPMDIDGLAGWLAGHPDAYIVTDTKETGEEAVRAQMSRLSRAVERAGGDLWDRVVIQIYNEDMLGWVREETGARSFIYTLYQTEEPDIQRIGEFCEENGIGVVTMDKSLLTAERSETLHSHGLLVYLHTVNRLSEMKNASWGADGFYTDFISPPQLAKIGF